MEERSTRYNNIEMSGKKGNASLKVPLQEAINRLAEYEDLEEQGLIVRLPCNVGGKLYLVYSPFGEIDEWEITDIQIGNKTKMLFRLGHKGTDDYAAVLEKELGECAFLTKAEAEKKLKELKGEE